MCRKYFRVNKFGNRSLSHCLIADANIRLVKVPSNMTHLFQPLDFTVNSWAKAYSKSTVHRPTDHRPPSHRPTVHRPPTHRPPSHRPKIYFKDQISLISENWTSAARMQLNLCRMYPYRLQFIFLKRTS